MDGITGRTTNRRGTAISQLAGHLNYFDLFDRVWFHRAWVAQEVVLAKKAPLVSGHVYMPWPSGETAKKCHRQYEIGWRSTQVSIDAKEDLRDSTGAVLGYSSCSTPIHPRSKTSACYASLYVRGCTDPMDKVFSLLGVAVHTDLANNSPGYSTSAGDVYDRLIRSRVFRKQNLDFLNWIAGPSKLHRSFFRDSSPA
jgi:hypothetical protein